MPPSDEIANRNLKSEITRDRKSSLDMRFIEWKNRVGFLPYYHQSTTNQILSGSDLGGIRLPIRYLMPREITIRVLTGMLTGSPFY